MNVLGKIFVDFSACSAFLGKQPAIIADLSEEFDILEEFRIIRVFHRFGLETLYGD